MKYLLCLALGLGAGSAAVAQYVAPIKPVPRYGPGSPVYQAPVPTPYPDRVEPVAPISAYEDAYRTRRHPRYSPAPRYGRAGPPGTMLPSGQVGPYCTTSLWKAGFHADDTRCPTYLPARPGAQELCYARDAAGRERSFTVTFLDWNPATRRGSVDCRLNR